MEVAQSDNTQGSLTAEKSAEDNNVEAAAGETKQSEGAIVSLVEDNADNTIIEEVVHEESVS